MPNHWHLVLWPEHDGDLSHFVGWISNTHVRRYNRFYGLDGRGHLYQGRFRSFPIQEDHHLLAVLRYVEANALRSELVERAQDWLWSSLATGLAEGGQGPGQWKHLLTAWPVPRPENWIELVNEQLKREEMVRLRESVRRGRPYGAGPWLERALAALGLAHTLRRPGRPRTPAEEVASASG